MGLAMAASSAYGWSHVHYRQAVVVSGNYVAPNTGSVIVPNHGIAPPNGFIITPNAGYAGFGYVPNAGFGYPYSGFGYPSAGFGYPSAGFGYPSAGFGYPYFGSPYLGSSCSGSGGSSGPTPRNPGAFGTSGFGIDDIRSGVQLFKEILDLLRGIAPTGTTGQPSPGGVPVPGGTPPGGTPTPAAGGDTLKSIDNSLKSIDNTLKDIQKKLTNPGKSALGTPTPDDRGDATAVEVSVAASGTATVGVAPPGSAANAPAMSASQQLEAIEAIRQQLPHLKPRQH
jgi:hypothetical protein